MEIAELEQESAELLPDRKALCHGDCGSGTHFTQIGLLNLGIGNLILL